LIAISYANVCIVIKDNMIHPGILSENIFHVSQSHFPVLASKVLQGLAPSVQELAVDLTLKNAATTLEDMYVEYYTRNLSSSNNVAVLPLIGEMSRYSYWGLGNEFLTKCLERIAQNEQYVGAVFKTNTPGGTADSCVGFADAIRAFPKPVIFHVENICCSSGMFVACQGDEIVVEKQASSLLGSLGTYILYQNYAGYFKNQGIEFEMIRAEGSEDKNKVNPYEPLSEEGRAKLVARATAAKKEFHGYVRAGRAGKLKSEEIFTGGEYNWKEAMALGLADRTGTLKDAINRVIQLSK
jgi:ClpP class serine protease